MPLIKKLGDFISQNSKPITFFSSKLSKPQLNYTTTEKELLAIVECPKKFRGIIFGYEINVFSDHKNMVYAATLSESQRVMLWKLIIEEFGPNIQHISGVDNIIADTLSILTSTPRDKYDPCTRKSQCCANNLFSIGRIEKMKIFPSKSINCTKITKKVTEEHKFQTQYIHFGLRIWLLHARTRRCRNNLL